MWPVSNLYWWSKKYRTKDLDTFYKYEELTFDTTLNKILKKKNTPHFFSLFKQMRSREVLGLQYLHHKF